MKKYDVVIANPGYGLRSGCEQYSHAIVISVNPFVLVSERADMRWSATVEPENFTVVGRAALATRWRVQRRKDK